jgi:hypothetical protein
VQVAENSTEGSVKRASSYLKKTKFTDKTDGPKRPRNRGLFNGFPAESASNPSPKTDNSNSDHTTLEAEFDKIKELPKEVGVMLITAGIVGIILPGPGTPAIIAGGLALWPNAFGRLRSWLQRHHPTVHHQSMKQICRFLNDLEKRYPYYAP